MKELNSNLDTPKVYVATDSLGMDIQCNPLDSLLRGVNKFLKITEIIRSPINSQNVPFKRNLQVPRRRAHGL